MKRSLPRLSLPFREPFVTAGGVVGARELVVLRLEASDGTVGWGRGGAVRALRRRAAGAGDRRAERRRRAATAPGARGGGDRPARPRGAPGGGARRAQARRPAGELVTLSGGPPEEVAERAREGLRAGYACSRSRSGCPGRGAGGGGARGGRPWPALRVDANRAWSVDDAVARIRELEQYDLEFVEQVRRTLDELRQVRGRVSTPIAADERSAPARGAPGPGDRGMRRGQREAGQRRRLQARPRGAAAGPGERARRVPVEHARRPLGHAPRCSWPPRRTCSWPAAGHARAVRLAAGARAAGSGQRDVAGVPSGPGWAWRSRRPSRPGLSSDA